MVVANKRYTWSAFRGRGILQKLPVIIKATYNGENADFSGRNCSSFDIWSSDKAEMPYGIALRISASWVK